MSKRMLRNIPNSQKERLAQELEDGSHMEALDLETKYMFYILVTKYYKTIIRNNVGFQKWLPFLSYALAPSVRRIVKLPLSLLAIRHYEQAL